MAKSHARASIPSDERWGGYLPWFLRVTEYKGAGHFELFFNRLSQRIHTYFHFNESGLKTPADHLGATLESETLQRFRFTPDVPLASQLRSCFMWQSIESETKRRLLCDPETVSAQKAESELNSANLIATLGAFSPQTRPFDPKRKKIAQQQAVLAKLRDEETKEVRRSGHVKTIILEKMGVLETILRIMPMNAATEKLIADIRRSFAEANILLDVKGIPPLIVPTEERFLQEKAIDALLPRLHSKCPNQAADLINAYHDLIQCKDTNTVFGNAFKALEEIAASLKGERFLLSDLKELRKHFPKFHETIYATIQKLAFHRGDKGAHFREGPTVVEMRYLLFAICNVALLMLEESEGNAG